MRGSGSRSERVWAHGPGWSIALCAFLFALLLAIHMAHLRFVFDDAYIHARIARNLASAGQPYFHLGEALKSSSSSGWTLLVGAVFRLVGSADVRFIALLNSATLFGLGLAVYRLLGVVDDGGLPIGWRIAGAALAVGGGISASTGLMETPLAILMITLAFTMLGRGNLWGFLLLGVAAGFRLETLVFAAAGGVVQLTADRRRTLPAAGLGLVGFLPFVLYDLRFFGTLIPHPVRAKSITYGLDRLGSLVTSTQEFWSDPLATVLWLTCAAAVVVWVVVIAKRGAIHSNRAFFMGYVVSGIVLWGAYVMARAFVFPWYLPLYFVPIITGAAWLAGRTKSMVPKLLSAVVVLPAVALLLGKGAGLVGHYEYSISSHANARVNQYLAVGSSLWAACPDCDLMTTEIGGLGFSFEGVIVDAVGLVTPEALGFHPMSVPDERPGLGTAGIPPSYFEVVQPALMVSPDTFAFALLKSDVIDEYDAWACPVFDEADEAIPWSERLWGMQHLWILGNPRKLDTAVIGEMLENEHRCVKAVPGTTK